MTVSEAITKSGITPSASYTGIETANDFVLAFQIESTQTKESQWIVCADHVKEHSGSDIIVPYIYFSLRTGKGEKGRAAIIVTSDVGGAAGSKATFACDVKAIGTPDEFDYNPATQSAAPAKAVKG